MPLLKNQPMFADLPIFPYHLITMLRCPNCGHDNPNNATQCAECSAALVQRCPSCGTRLPASDCLCPACGAQLDGAAPLNNPIDFSDPKAVMNERMLSNLRDSIPIVLARKIDHIAAKMVGQRREVTVLMVGVSKFTNASQRLNSQEGFLMLDDLMHTLADVIYDYEGTIDKLSGNSMMALFGLPINHENDPERAVRAALEILNVVEPLREKYLQDYGLDVGIRIGINTGLVIAGNLGNQRQMEYSVIGDTVNLASVLESQAEHGTALISFRTYQRTHPIFNFEEVLPAAFDEEPAPARAYRPLSVRAITGQVRGLPGLQVPLMGREDDILKISDAFIDVVEQKKSRVVFLSGDAGIGKTRLVSEFCKSINDQQARIYFGTCASYMRITPYRVVADILRNIIHVTDMVPDEIQLEALRYHLEQLNLEDPDLLAYLVKVLGISQPDPFAEIRLKLLDPAMLQRQIHSALLSFFYAEAFWSPSVLIFDDLHWIDPASRDFLEYFIQAIDKSPILLVLVSRAFYGSPDTEVLVSAAKKRREEPLVVHLEPLSPEDSRLLIDRLLYAPTHKTSTVKDHIITRSFGNPYYMEELVRILLDNGGLERQETDWLINESASELVQEVPGTLQDIILARFDLLPEDLKDTLQRAAVLRSAFGTQLLFHISDISKEQLLRNLEELENRGFLEALPMGNEDGYAFKHPLLQETIYNTLVKRDLRPLHTQIALVIEAGESSLPGEQNELLAYHYAESTVPQKAIPYLLHSADNASQRFANETAVQYYRQALDLMEASPEVTEEQMIEVQIQLGRALKFTGNFKEALEVLEKVFARLFVNGEDASSDPRRAGLYLECLRELADIRTREGKLTQAIELLQQGLNLVKLLEADEFLIQEKRLVDRLAWAYFRQGKLNEAYELANQALATGETWHKEAPITLASLYNTLGGIHWMRSNYKEAIECVKPSLEVYRELNYIWGMAIAYTNLGVLQFSAGNWQESINSLEQADALRDQNGYLQERPTSLKNLGEALICTGDYNLAQQKFETSLEISKRYGMSIAAAYAEIGLCRLLIAEGRALEARDHLDHAQRLLSPSIHEVDDRTFQLYHLQAQIEAEMGHYERGLELAQKAYQMAVEGGFYTEENQSLWLLGIIKSRLQMYDQAIQHLLDALQLSKQQGDQFRQAQVLFEMSHVYLARAKAHDVESADTIGAAQEALREAIDIFSELGAKDYLARAQADLSRLTKT